MILFNWNLVFPVGFVLAAQPLPMLLLIVGSVVSTAPLLHLSSPFHWANYLFLLVYLGGLLVLFLYFTTFMGGFQAPLRGVWALVFLPLLLPSPLEGVKSSGGGGSALFLFARPEASGGLALLAVILLWTFFFIPFHLSSPLPSREVYESIFSLFLFPS